MASSEELLISRSRSFLSCRAAPILTWTVDVSGSFCSSDPEVPFVSSTGVSVVTGVDVPISIDNRGRRDGIGESVIPSEIGEALMPVSILDRRGGGGVAAETL